MKKEFKINPRLPLTYTSRGGIFISSKRETSGEGMREMGKFFNDQRIVKCEGAPYEVGKAATLEEAVKIVESLNNPDVRTVLDHDYKFVDEGIEDIITLEKEIPLEDNETDQ